MTGRKPAMRTGLLTLGISRRGVLILATAVTPTMATTAMGKASAGVDTAASEAASVPSRSTLPVHAQGTPCINGYRTIHVVHGQGRVGQGVTLRCRG
jgi:hypothetical protein